VQSDISLHSAEEGGKTLKNKMRKSKNIEISFNTKKKTPSQTKNNSQRQLFTDQYSLDNRIYATTKEPHNLVVSFRGNKKHEINISLSGRRMKT
jgi:adenine C2-methylase RlmN of 23S rRNA A2503 and tRNA A37